MVETIKIDGNPFFQVSDARLSESVTYMSKAQALLWVDIYKAQIHRITDFKSPTTSYSMVHIDKSNYDGLYPIDTSLPERVGVIFPIDNESGIEKVLFGGKYGIGLFDYVRNKWNYLILYSQSGLCVNWDKMRSNDGNISRNGEIFIGLMHDFQFSINPKQLGEGILFKINLKKNLIKPIWSNFHISNGIFWFGNNIYITDSMNFVNWKFELNDEDDPIVSTKTPFINFKPINSEFASPEPDGNYLDTITQTLYTAVWSTHKIQVFSIPDGKLIKQLIITEASRITSCCVGYEGNLFVTTASKDIINGTNGDKGGSIYQIHHSLLNGFQKNIGSSKLSPVY